VGGGASTKQWADKIGAGAYAGNADDGVRKINQLTGS
jgi:methanogenic corrinoid protein MtbC1